MADLEARVIKLTMGGLLYLVCVHVLGKSEEETLEELSSRATSRMTSGASHRSRAPTSMGMATIQENAGTMPSVVPGTQLMDVLVAHSQKVEHG